MRGQLEAFFNQYWYSPKRSISYYVLLIVLLPLSWIFALLSSTRRALYHHQFLKSYKLPVPVIVVGNINVGGTGKTPLVIWLAQALKLAGYTPGIISRGFGGKVQGEVLIDTNPHLLGDEPLLIKQRTQSPVFVGKNRVLAGRHLLKAYPQCNVIISDDGLQHSQLQRDFEIVVVDSQRQFGNKTILPAGPLRESVQRLTSVNAVVINGEHQLLTAALQGALVMNLQAQLFVNLVDNLMVFSANILLKLAQTNHQTIRAIAGIGNPQRFFNQLMAMGLEFESQAFSDHYQYQADDFSALANHFIVMTEKDAVKCQQFATPNMWYLPITANLPNGSELVAHITKQIHADKHSLESTK